MEHNTYIEQGSFDQQVPYQTPLVREYESEQLDQLFTALAKAQGEMEVAKEDSANPFFKSKYADLASIVRASRLCLAKHGLSVIQRILPHYTEQVLVTRLCHSSGQWIESSIQIHPEKSDIQSLGKYITYLRRYAYSSLVGVVTAGEDDDGESVMNRPVAHSTNVTPPSYQKPVQRMRTA